MAVIPRYMVDLNMIEEYRGIGSWWHIFLDKMYIFDFEAVQSSRSSFGLRCKIIPFHNSICVEETFHGNNIFSLKNCCISYVESKNILKESFYR